MKTDKKIEQNPVIALQIAKAIQGYTGNAPINITLNMNATQIGSDTSDPEVFGKHENLDLMALLETFPQPRLRNLIEHIYFLTFKTFGTKRQASDWLGVSARTLHRCTELSKIAEIRRPISNENRDASGDPEGGPDRPSKIGNLLPVEEH